MSEDNQQKGLTERDILLNKIRCVEEKQKVAEYRLCEAERIHKEEIKALEKKKNKRITFLKQMVKKLNHEKACAWGMLVPIPYSYYDVYLWGEKAFRKEYVEKVRKAESEE